MGVVEPLERRPDLDVVGRLGPGYAPRPPWPHGPARRRGWSSAQRRPARSRCRGRRLQRLGRDRARSNSRGLPGFATSTSPAIWRSSYRPRQFNTVVTVESVTPAIRMFASPSAASSRSAPASRPWPQPDPSEFDARSPHGRRHAGATREQAGWPYPMVSNGRPSICLAPRGTRCGCSRLNRGHALRVAGSRREAGPGLRRRMLGPRASRRRTSLSIQRPRGHRRSARTG